MPGDRAMTGSDASRRERCLDERRESWVKKRYLMVEAMLDPKSEFLESKQSCQDSDFRFQLFETI